MKCEKYEGNYYQWHNAEMSCREKELSLKVKLQIDEINYLCRLGSKSKKLDI